VFNRRISFSKGSDGLIEFPVSARWLHEDVRDVSGRHLNKKDERNEARALSSSGEFIYWRLSSGFYFVASSLRAGVAELADALDSKSSDRKIVWVRSPPPASLAALNVKGVSIGEQIEFARPMAFG
jgi:hypothetical protein